MFNVLDASCQDIWVHSSYTLALIYSTTTAGCSRTKPLQLQPAAQDPPTAQGMQNQLYFRHVKLQQHSNSAHAYKVKQAGREQMLCSLSSFRYSLILGSLWRWEQHSWLPSLSNTHLYLSDGSSAPVPFRDEAGEREPPYQMDNCLVMRCNHCP